MSDQSAVPLQFPRFAKWVYSIGVLRVVPQKYISLPLIKMKVLMTITNIYLL